MSSKLLVECLAKYSGTISATTCTKVQIVSPDVRTDEG